MSTAAGILADQVVVNHAGILDYQVAWQLQRETLEGIVAGTTPEPKSIVHTRTLNGLTTVGSIKANQVNYTSNEAFFMAKDIVPSDVKQERLRSLDSQDSN